MKSTIAQILLKNNCIGFALEKPITFKSGLISPVYIDNRTLPFFPQDWKIVIEGFKQLIASNKLEFDIIAGIETAGIPHSAALGFSVQKPSVFVRKQAKDHGTKKMVEGGVVKDHKILLIEDHITTGMSSLKGVDSIRNEGGIVENCLSITSYAFSRSASEFANKKVALHTLTDFPAILEEAIKMNKISTDQKTAIESWLANPWDWAKNRLTEK